MNIESCRFETERLLVNEWRSLSSSDWREQDLADVVISMLTENVTHDLPGPWRGSYTVERGRQWVNERDEEGTTLLAIEKSTRQAVGLMILSEVQDTERVNHTDMRLGYLLSEDHWGKGLASEMVTGFIDWCRHQTSILSISGGVATDNIASIRVLQKNGFMIVEPDGKADGDEMLYRLRLRDQD